MGRGKLLINGEVIEQVYPSRPDGKTTPAEK
jgi:hypothetical protein